jgi:hypothetical protein
VHRYEVHTIPAVMATRCTGPTAFACDAAPSGAELCYVETRRRHILPTTGGPVPTTLPAAAGQRKDAGEKFGAQTSRKRNRCSVDRFAAVGPAHRGASDSWQPPAYTHVVTPIHDDLASRLDGLLWSNEDAPTETN